MKISIITPHFNDFKGIQQTHNCLLKQDSDQWEWIIVDDYSDVLNMSVYERRQYLSHLLNENNRKTEALEEQKEEIIIELPTKKEEVTVESNIKIGKIVLKEISTSLCSEKDKLMNEFYPTKLIRLIAKLNSSKPFV